MAGAHEEAHGAGDGWKTEPWLNLKLDNGLYSSTFDKRLDSIWIFSPDDNNDDAKEMSKKMPTELMAKYAEKLHGKTLMEDLKLAGLYDNEQIGIEGRGLVSNFKQKDGTEGFRIRGNKRGYRDRSIFLPFTVYRDSTSVVEGESIDGVTEWANTSDGSYFYPDYQEGYVSCRYLVKISGDEPTPEPEPEPTPSKVYRVHTNSGDALRIREEPNTSSKQVGCIDNGKEVTVTEIVEGESIDYVTEWGKVNYNGVVGFCSMRYLEEV